MASIGAERPVKRSKLSAPWPTRSSSPSRTGIDRAEPPSPAACPSGACRESTTQIPGDLIDAHGSDLSICPEASRPLEVQLTSRSAGAAWSTGVPPSSAHSARARSGVRFQTRTSRAPASSSAHTAARALPPAPSTSAVLPARRERQRRDQRRGVGVVGADRAVVVEHERVGGADRRRARGSPRRRAPAPPACAGSSRSRRGSRRRGSARTVSAKQLGRDRQQLVAPAVEPRGRAARRSASPASGCGRPASRATPRRGGAQHVAGAQQRRQRALRRAWPAPAGTAASRLELGVARGERVLAPLPHGLTTKYR